jgi:UDP-N-acetylglucosamine diphosphorylase/glucosamine-1-phosphate N-acetyltransferase
VGGEVNNSVMQAYSNKGHDGFLGNSVIGEWCNLGADTNNSNLKNNYGEVDIYDYAEKKYKGSGLQFCGLFMGDHSKCGINTMFNTGTVVGVSANIFGAGFPPKFIPSFSWGGFDRNIAFRIDKALELALRVMERRDYTPAKEELAVLNHLYQNRENE